MSLKDTRETEHSVMFTSGEAPVGPGEQFLNRYAQKILASIIQNIIYQEYMYPYTYVALQQP